MLGTVAAPCWGAEGLGCGCRALHWHLAQIHEGPGLPNGLTQMGRAVLGLSAGLQQEAPARKEDSGLEMLKTLDHTLASPWPGGFLAELCGHLGPSGPGNLNSWSLGSCRPWGLTPQHVTLVTAACG